MLIKLIVTGQSDMDKYLKNNDTCNSIYKQQIVIVSAYLDFHSRGMDRNYEYNEMKILAN